MGGPEFCALSLEKAQEAESSNGPTAKVERRKFRMSMKHTGTESKTYLFSALAINFGIII